MPKFGIAAVALAAVCAAPSAALSEPRAAGHALWVFGQVERVGSDQLARPLAKGDPVFEGDLIRSGPGSQAQLVMSDEALIAIRAQSSLRLGRYRYRADEGGERAIIELMKGGLRSITGAIGRGNKENYRLKSEMHVIGIRGTDHEAFVTEAGTFNRVTAGGTYLQGPGGRVDLAPGEVGFASFARDRAPQRLEATPEFMHLAAFSAGGGYTGPLPRIREGGDASRLQNSPGANAVGAAVSAGPAAGPGSAGGNAGGNAHGKDTGVPNGFGRGGRCDGPCVDTVKKSRTK